MTKKTRERIEDLERQLRVLMFERELGDAKFMVEVEADKQGKWGLLQKYYIALKQIGVRTQNGKEDVISTKTPLKQLYPYKPNLKVVGDYLLVDRSPFFDNCTEVFIVSNGYLYAVPIELYEQYKKLSKKQ